MVNNKKEKNPKNRLKPKEKILKYLIENKEPHSIRETSSATSIDYKNTHNIINELQLSGSVVAGSIGNTKPISINLSPNQEIFNTEQKRTKEFLNENPKLKLIQEEIQEINYPFMIVLVFGSYVKGKKTETSDIDICIICDDEDKKQKLIQKLRLFSLKLEIHDFTAKEFTSMIEINQKNLGHEIIKNNVILYGIENYYNLISKWMKKE